MMRETTIKLSRELHDRAAKYAAVAGYSSTEEFITHVVEKEVAAGDAASSGPDALKQLKGIGYIDAGLDI